MKRAALFIVALAWLFHIGGQAAYGPTNKYVRLRYTNLPIVWLTVDGTINRTDRVTARMKIIDNGPGQYNYADTVAYQGQHIDYDGFVGLRYRGHSSYVYSLKEPYSLRPLDRPLEEGGSWKKASLLGMPRDSRWALLAPFNDKSMMRDMLAFEISRPWMPFTPQGRYCEVLLNGVYYGVFILAEVPSPGKNRLDLEDPGESGDELTGGYMMEVERGDEPHYLSKYLPVYSDGTVIHSRRIHYHYKFPDYEDFTTAQLDYIQGLIDAMEQAMASHKFRNKTTGECDYFDEMSFIDYQLATELGHNVDGYRLSGKFYKQRDSRDPHFKMVLWDMNLAYGNANYYDGWRTDTWVYQMNDVLMQAGTSDMVPFWWFKLNLEKKYVEHLKERWAQYRDSNLSVNRLLATVDSLATLLTVGGAEGRNSRAYPYWGVQVWPNYYLATDFADEVDYLKRWLMRRIHWMDKQLGYEPYMPPGDVNGDGETTISDVNVIIEIIMGGEVDESTLGRADINGDGEVTVSDINAVIEIITIQ